MPKAIERKPLEEGVDVSEHNGKPDWDKAKADGVEFALIRLGYGSDTPSQDDEQFERNVRECERVGIQWGAYIYSYALDVEHALSEVEHAKRKLEGKNPVLVAYDMEDADHYKRDHGVIPEENKELFSDICYTWLSSMQDEGYEVRLYANLHWLNNILDSPKLAPFFRWVAQWGDECTYGGKFDIWQYSSQGHVDGIDGRVDMNYSYREFKPAKHVDEPERKTKAEHIETDTYHIADGDTLWDLENEWHLHHGTLQKLNPKVDPKRLQVGQKIFVPGAVRKPKPEHHHHSGRNAVIPYPGRLFEVKHPMMHGDDVKAIQRALNNAVGHQIVKVDGWYGRHTSAAVRDYQGRHGLKQDGIVGPNTWNTLF